MTDNGPVIPDEYPYVDTNPSAFCWWFHHGKASVRSVWIRGVGVVERYDCRCGKFYWLSQADGYAPIVRHRAEVAS